MPAGGSGEVDSAAPAASPPKLNSGFLQLFKTFDKDGDGVVSMEELVEAIKKDKNQDALVSGSTRLRDILQQWDEGKGSRKTITEEEFVLAMHDFFEDQYSNRIASVDFKGLFARAMVDGWDNPLLKGETSSLQPFGHLKSRSVEDCQHLVGELLDKIKDELVSEVSNLFSAARQYEEQETQVREASGGRFCDPMLLGHSKMFDLGPEGLLGLPGSNHEASIQREHSSVEAFDAWNNEEKRTTSPKAQFDKVLPKGWGGEINPFDYSGDKRMCDNFMEHPMTKAAGLKKVEVVVLRLYSGPMFTLYNNATLRKFLPKIEFILKGKKDSKAADSLLTDSDVSTEDLQEAVKHARKELGGAYATTILVLVSAIMKLRKVTPLPKDGKVYRGIAGLSLPKRMLYRDKKGNCGGVDVGFVSTSTDKNVALSYVKFSKGEPQLLEFPVSHIDRGADLSWVSYFPGEAEVLLPPLCGVALEGEARYECVSLSKEKGGEKQPVWVKIWPARLNVNSKGKTIEEHEGARKEIFLKATDEVLAQVEKDVLGFRDTEPFKARARTDTFLMTENDQKKRTIKEFEDSVLNEFKTQISKWEGKAPREFNDAATFTGVYSRLLQMLHLTELKKRYWLQSPEGNLRTIGVLSLKASQRAGLARNRKILNAEGTPAELKVAAAKELLSFLGAASDDIEAKTEGENILHRVCAEGNFELASLVVAANAKLGVRTDEQETALMLAAGAGAEAVCRLLLDSTAGQEVDAVDQSGRTALYKAARGGFPLVLDLLVARKANVNLGVSPLDIAAYSGHVESVSALIKAGAKVDARRTDGSTPVLMAAQNGHAEVVQALANARCDVNLATDTGATPVLMAAQDGHAEAVSLLIQAKCDVDKAKDTGATPVLMAAQKGHAEAVSLLIQAKCDVDKANDTGATPVLLAAQKGHAEAVSLLIQAKCDVDKAKDTGATPVLMAAQDGHAEAVSLLIQAKCDVDKANNNTWTPLAIAASGGHVEVVRKLVAAGADKSAQTKWGTALQNAKDDVKDQAKLAEIVKLLE